jgi:hypothetical protein
MIPLSVRDPSPTVEGSAGRDDGASELPMILAISRPGAMEGRV